MLISLILGNDVQRNLKIFATFLFLLLLCWSFFQEILNFKEMFCSSVTRFILMLVLFTLLHTPFIFKKFMMILYLLLMVFRVMWCVFFLFTLSTYISCSLTGASNLLASYALQLASSIYVPTFQNVVEPFNIKSLQFNRVTSFFLQTVLLLLQVLQNLT